jgi:cytochrome c biogenesis protein CcdA
MKDMLEQNLPIVLIYILMMATREQETTEGFIESIKMQQKQQSIERINLIQETTAAQAKREAAAGDPDDWKARVNIDRTGAPRKDDPPEDNCGKVILGAILIGIGIITFFFGGGILLLAVGAVLITVCAIITQIAKAAIKSQSQMRQFEKVMGWINPAELLTDAIVEVVCEIGGYNPNDEKMQKLKMILKITFNVLAAVALVIAGIAATIVTGGAAAPAIAMAVMGIIMGIIQLACAVLEYKQAEKELELSEKRFALNKILAVIEQIKMNLEVIGQDLDLLIEMFASKMSDVREEYEKASRVLKEYNDTKRAIAQNIRS